MGRDFAFMVRFNTNDQTSATFQTGFKRCKLIHITPEDNVYADYNYTASTGALAISGLTMAKECNVLVIGY